MYKSEKIFELMSIRDPEGSDDIDNRVRDPEDRPVCYL